MMLPWEAKKQVEELFDLIFLEERLCLEVEEAKSFQEECCAVRERVKQISQMLKTLIRFITSAPTSIYLRPINCIVAKVKDNFELALATVSKCKCRSLLSSLFTIRNATRFRGLSHLLDASISDMEWLVTVYDPQNGVTGPTTQNESARLLVWSCIATVKMGRQLEDRVQAAKCLGLLAQEKDEYKNIIFEEGGVPPLIKLLKENSSLTAQITAANALCLLANEQERTRIIMKEMISTVVYRLSRTSPTRDQIQAANLVAKIAEYNPEVKEYDLVRENVIWRLVTLLSSEPSADGPKINLLNPELKISCSKALWVLVEGSVSNCRTLTETKGMLCLAKLVETEQDELQYNCLMIIREITSIAESNQEFRHSAFKTNSLAAMTVVDQLLRVIKEFDDKKLRIPAIKSMGSLARTFSAKDSRVISPLVSRLGSTDQEIAMEAAIALQNFACPENRLSKEHSQSIVKFDGVPLLMKLLDGDEESQHHGLALICYLANHDINSNVLIEAGALTALETIGAKHPKLKGLVSDAIFKLKSNQTGKHEKLDSSVKASITQIIVEQNKEAVNYLRQGPEILWKRLTGFAQKPEETFPGDCKPLPIVMRCKERFSHAQPSFKTGRILPLLRAKAKYRGSALRCVINYPGRRQATEVARGLRLMINIVNSFGKKVIRRKFGFVIHKIM
ncbi:hypothetical protein POUND7_016960 [Theobroma cacao]